jgi:hypothetical protein
MQGSLAAFVNHPALISEFDEFLASLDLPGRDLDNLRHEVLNVAASNGKVDAAALKSHLQRSGFRDVLGVILSGEVYAHVPYARPGTDADVVRAGLRGLRDKLQRRRIEADAVGLIAEIGESADYAKVGRFTSFVRVNQRAHEHTDEDETFDGTSR